MKIIIKYNIKYRTFNLIRNIYFKLIKIKNIDYYISKKNLLFIKKVSLYKFFKKINTLIYKLKFLSNIFKIYLIILIIYLK